MIIFFSYHKSSSPLRLPTSCSFSLKQTLPCQSQNQAKKKKNEAKAHKRDIEDDYSWTWGLPLCVVDTQCHFIVEKWFSLSQPLAFVRSILVEVETLCPVLLLNAEILSGLSLCRFCACFHSLCKFSCASVLFMSRKYCFLGLIHNFLQSFWASLLRLCQRHPI